MEFDEEITNRYRKAKSRWDEASQKVAEGILVLVTTKERCAEVTSKIPIPGPDIRNWSHEDATELAAQLKIMGAAYVVQGDNLEDQANSLLDLSAIMLELRELVLKAGDSQEAAPGAEPLASN